MENASEDRNTEAIAFEGAARVPSDTPNFTGRREILKELNAILFQPVRDRPNVVVVEGMPGVGKTALAIHWAYANQGKFPDGSLFVDLRGYSANTVMTQDEALRQLLTAMNVPGHQIPDDSQARAAIYQERLTGKKVLLILDNASDENQLEDLLPRSPGPLALVTSRSHFRRFEHADSARILQLGILSPDDALALLASMVGEQRIQYEPGAAKELADLCGYLPLALRIVAANLSSRPNSEISSAVQDLNQEPLSALTLNEAPNITVRNTVDLSYRNLDNYLKRTFRVLGLFEGRDLTADGAAALLGVYPEVAQAHLAKLRLANLIEATAPGRYRLHDLIREYARERARADDQESERFTSVHQLLDWYLTTARDLGDFLGRRRRSIAGELPPVRLAADPEDWEFRLRWFEAERENLVAATRQASDIEGDPIAWELPDALFDFLELRGYSGDNVEVHRLGLAAAERTSHLLAESYMRHHLAVIDRELGRYDSAIDQAGKALELNKQLHDRYAEAAALNNLARIRYVTGDYSESLSNAETALAIRQEIGDRLGEAQTLNSMGRTLRALGRYTEALRTTLEALDIRQEIEDRLGQAETIETLARLYRLIGWYEEAAKCGHKALEMRRGLGDRLGEGESLQNLARVYRRLGVYTQAREYAFRALDIMQDTEHRRGIAEAYATLGDIQLDSAPDLREALENYRLALEIRQEIGDQRGISESYLSVARALRKNGGYEESVKNAQRSRDISAEIGDRFGEARAADSLARTYQLTQNYDYALEAAELALRIRREIGDCRGEGDTLDNIARIYRRTGAYRRALTFAESAYNILRNIGDRRGQGKALDSIARTQLDLGMPEAAIKTARRAAETWSELGEPRSLSKTLDVLETIAYGAVANAKDTDRPSVRPRKLQFLFRGMTSIFDLTGVGGISRLRERVRSGRLEEIDLTRPEPLFRSRNENGQSAQAQDEPSGW